MPSGNFAYMDEDRQKHYAAVGRVVVEWTRLENEIAVTVRFLAELDFAVGSCLIAQIPNTARMIDAMWSLSEHRSPGITKEKDVRKMTDKIMGLGEKRNRVVHDLWLFDPGTQTRHQTTAKRSLKTTFTSMPTNEVTSVGDEIEAMLVEFTKFRSDLLRALRPPSGNPRART